VPISVSTFREQLEEMNADALDEYYRHSAGLKPTLEIAAIYGRYPELSSLEQVQAMEAEAAPRALRQYAAEAYIGNGVKLLTEQAANTEAELTVPLGDELLPYRAVRPRLMNEPDASRRHDLYQRRCEATEEHINPILSELTETERRLTREVGAENVLALYTHYGYDPVGLHASTTQFLADTDELYRHHMDARLHTTLGLSLDTASPADLARVWRAPEFDREFTPERALPALRATLAELGVDLDAQPNVELDVEDRPNKQPRAFCAPVRVPDRVVLVTLPQGGQEDYQALFHEAGHTEHFAHTSRDLPAEDRLLGDNGVTEGFAFLIEHVLSDRSWLSARLDFGPIDEYTRFSALNKLFFLRRYAAKLAYEIELHAGAALDTLPGRYSTILTDAVGVPYPATDYLEDVDGGFYCTCYLRAWAFETQLRNHLRDRFGTQWHRTTGAGSLIREMWNLGQSENADDLLEQVTGSRIDFGVLSTEAHEALA
jgi:hypothetical protein